MMFSKDVSGRWAIVVVVVALLIGAPGIGVPGGVQNAYATMYTFEPEGGNIGDWHDADNWNPTGVPNSHNDDAVIPAGKFVQVTTADAVTGSINVQADGDDEGWIILQGGYDLILGTDREGVESIVDGYVLFGNCAGLGSCPAIQIVRDDVVIKSTNGRGQIRGGNNWDRGDHADYNEDLSGLELAPGRIHYDDDVNDNYLLIIEDDVAIVGHVEISVRLQNDAIVMVDDYRHVDDDVNNIESKDTIVLNGRLKTGSGQWLCRGGLIDVRCEITGLSAWILENPRVSNNPAADLVEGEESSQIWISDVDATDVDGLSGPVTILGGTFLVNENFCTVGKIIYRSPHNTVQPLIQVAEDKSAKFSLSCP